MFLTKFNINDRFTFSRYNSKPAKNPVLVGFKLVFLNKSITH